MFLLVKGQKFHFETSISYTSIYVAILLQNISVLPGRNSYARVNRVLMYWKINNTVSIILKVS